MKIANKWLPVAALIGAAEVSAIPLPTAFGELRLGAVDFPVSSSIDDAKDWFNYGLLQIFAFGYDYATPAFQEAQAIDPGFALAYAFEAFAEFNPLWSKDDAAAANAIFSKMDDANATASAREQLYIDAFRAHFDTSMDVIDRNRKAANILQTLTEDYPDDPTAFSYVGLFSLVVSASSDDEGEVATSFDKAAEALNKSLGLQDDHPGSVHFQLHAYDNISPDIWQQGLPAARKYPQVAPDTSHGLHMPQHILHRSGDFAASWDADFQALQAADITCARYGMGDDPTCDLWNLYHSVEYLQISGYECGLWEGAHSFYERMEANYTTAVEGNFTNAPSLLNFVLRMRAREFLNSVMVTGSLLDGEPLDVDCPPPIEPLAGNWYNGYTESGYLLARGLCLVGTSYPSVDEASFNDIMTRMSEITEYYASYDTSDPLNYYDRLIHSGHVAMLQGASRFVQDGGGGPLFEEAMVNATNYEEASTEFWSPGVWTMLHLSPHEFYGQLLLVQGNDESKTDDERTAAIELSMQEFLASDRTQGPQLSTSLGKARAASLAGNSTEALENYNIIAEMMHADSDTEMLQFWDEVQSGLVVADSDPTDTEDSEPVEDSEPIESADLRSTESSALAWPSLLPTLVCVTVLIAHNF